MNQFISKPQQFLLHDVDMSLIFVNGCEILAAFLD